MALSDVASGAGVVPAGKAPEAGAPSNLAKQAGKKGNPRHAEFIAKGNSIRTKMSDEEKQIEGSKSDKVAFVASLGDPTRGQSRKEKNEDIPSHTVVGYAFKALEDMTIPRADIKSGFSSYMDVGPMTEEKVKAGDIFYLNLFETGALISKNVYAGSFSGEGTTVTLSVKYSKDRPEPLPVLNKKGSGSVKENMILIADMVGADPANKIKGTPKIKDEFASKFSVLYEKKVAGRKGSSNGSKKAGESTKDIAAAFNAYLNSRR